MPAEMNLVITVRKRVADRDQGEIVFRIVEQKLADRPDLTIAGHVTNHFELTPAPPPP